MGPLACFISAHTPTPRPYLLALNANALPPLDSAAEAAKTWGMRSLLGHSFDPATRFVRLALAEKGLMARIIETRPGEQDGDLAKVNPALSVPVLIDEPPSGGEIAVAPVGAIAEYLEEAYGETPLLPATSAGRAEARRLFSWFTDKFDSEATALIARPRALGARGRRWGDPEPIREFSAAIVWHFDYLSFLLERRRWIAGDRLSIADLAAGAALSVNDYFNLLPWADFPDVRDWYARIKSRPSMRSILADRLDGAPASAHYENPDF
ncbi:MAG: glutathione S-transferase family protein [Parvularculaceae bacterium]|nr:glutathione S-transferase family protein [Parvularculaceae bacterium]